MKNRKQIEQEVEKTLESLDNVSRATANPYLFTRIKARLQNPQTVWEQISSFISRPVVAMATLILIMAINFWVVFSSNSKSSDNETVAAMDIADAYNQDITINYEYESVGE